jgi:isocitrate dehydrogenase (NAD+)
LRKELGVFAGVRPIRNLAGVDSRYQNVNILLVRELTEGTYSGIEHEIVPGVMETIKITTADKCRRIVEYAFDLARRKNRKRVTLVHKANIMKQSDGMFVRIGKEVAAQNPDIEFRDIIIDNCTMQMVAKPEQFDVMVADNMFGDILSDVGAGLLGSPLLVPSINIGEGVRIYEATHHLKYEKREDGQAIADPFVLLVPAAHLLDHLGYPVARKRLEAAMAKVAVAHQTLTPDLGGIASTNEMTDAIIAALPPASAYTA